jgi:hypothetical protein
MYRTETNTRLSQRSTFRIILENTLFSTKNACKEWPIGFMIWSIEILRKGPSAHLVKIFPYHCTCGNVDETIKEESKEEVIAVIKSLDALAEFYDNMSFIDSITIGTEVPDSSNSYILHSKRNFNDTDATNTLEHIEKDNLSSEIEVRAF